MASKDISSPEEIDTVIEKLDDQNIGVLDAEEAQAIARVFGGRRQAVPVTAAKSYFGNLGAAAGMVEVIGSLLAFEHDLLFSTLNYETPDPACPIHVVREPVAPGNTFINLNLTPQGQASAIVIRRP